MKIIISFFLIGFSYLLLIFFFDEIFILLGMQLIWVVFSLTRVPQPLLSAMGLAIIWAVLTKVGVPLSWLWALGLAILVIYLANKGKPWWEE